ncbi:MAG: anaerobic ribonucleoside-triphosphate reductase activating protein [Spirochaetes bacterium GWF1_51_8]|nr:MAG: anaerobic ribonucleoside-triphosphate reductase activating protein [Spirochaetes bacterium GWF1_51_8]
MFKGLQKVTLIDFPGVIAATVFTGGCNFRCPWCHNWGLVDPGSVREAPDIEESEILEYLDSRAGRIGGVCVTGGEPTLHGIKLVPFFEKLKQRGLKVKLDTNGYEPEILQMYIRRGVIDYIAMDIKNTFQKYAPTAGLSGLDLTRIERSIAVIRTSGLPHTFRTTVVPGMVDRDEIGEFEQIAGETVVIQGYRDILQEMLVEAERRG